MHIASLFVLHGILAVTTADGSKPYTVDVTVQAFRDNLPGTSIADVSKACHAKYDASLDCGFGSPLEDAGVFEVQPSGIVKTIVALGCVPALNKVSHLVIMVPFYCSNKTTNRPVAVCRAKLHIEILGPTESPHFDEICKNKVFEPINSGGQHSPSGTTTVLSTGHPSPSVTQKRNSYKQLSVEISAAIGGGSTILIFLTACLTLKCWLYARYHRQVKNFGSNQQCGPLGDDNEDGLRQRENGSGEVLPLTDIVSTPPIDTTKSDSAKVVVDLAEVPTDVFHEEAHIAKGGALAQTLAGLQSGAGSSVGQDRHKLKQIQQWVSEQQKLRDNQWTTTESAVGSQSQPHGSVENNNFATSTCISILPQQSINEDFVGSPQSQVEVYHILSPDTEHTSKCHAPQAKAPIVRGGLLSPSHASSPHRVQGPLFQLPATLTHAQLAMQRKSSTDMARIGSLPT